MEIAGGGEELLLCIWTKRRDSVSLYAYLSRLWRR